MIILDTHIWLWLVNENPRLKGEKLEFIRKKESDGWGVSAISCWEVAKKVEKGKLDLGFSIEDWIVLATHYPGIRIIDLLPEISVESTKLPGEFHGDPADQIIVATARILNCTLVTCDNKILKYSEVHTV